MTTEYTRAQNELAVLLSQRTTDAARKRLCEELIRGKLSSQSHQGWQIFCAWSWLEQSNRLAALGFRASLALPEQLDTCVVGCRETLQKENAARRKIREHWPSWDMAFGQYTPARFSVGLLQIIAALSSKTSGAEHILVPELMARVRRRLQSSQSTLRAVKVRDVESVLREVTQRQVEQQPPPPQRGSSASREVERPRRLTLPVPDRHASSTFLSFPESRSGVEPFPEDFLLDDDDEQPLGSPPGDDQQQQQDSPDLLDDLEDALSNGLPDPLPPSSRSPSAPPNRPPRRPRARPSVRSRIATLLRREMERERSQGRHDALEASQHWMDEFEEDVLCLLPNHWK